MSPLSTKATFSHSWPLPTTVLSVYLSLVTLETSDKYNRIAFAFLAYFIQHSVLLVDPHCSEGLWPLVELQSYPIVCRVHIFFKDPWKHCSSFSSDFQQEQPSVFSLPLIWDRVLSCSRGSSQTYSPPAFASQKWRVPVYTTKEGLSRGCLSAALGRLLSYFMHMCDP